MADAPRQRKDLTDWVEARPSPIHGKGCFARKLIRKGAFIGSYEGPHTMRDGRYVLWVDDGDGEWRGVRGENELKYLNHSSSPNAEFDGEELTAIRTIRAGEEITFHYCDEWEGVE
jgi:uncharacterized protein